MEIGDIVSYDGRKGVVTRTFMAGARGDTKCVTVWFGNQLLTTSEEVEGMELTGEKCPQIVGILNILNKKEKENEK